jgi:hypothetical protein
VHPSHAKIVSPQKIRQPIVGHTVKQVAEQAAVYGLAGVQVSGAAQPLQVCRVSNPAEFRFRPRAPENADGGQCQDRVAQRAGLDDQNAFGDIHHAAFHSIIAGGLHEWANDNYNALPLFNPAVWAGF